MAFNPVIGTSFVDTNDVFTVSHHKVGNYNKNKMCDALKIDYYCSLKKNSGE